MKFNNITQSNGMAIVMVVDKTQQPNTGYVDPKLFHEQKIRSDHEQIPQSEENIAQGIIEHALRNIVRLKLGESKSDVFRFAQYGGDIVSQRKTVDSYIEGINEADEKNAIINSIRLADYEIIYRAGVGEYGKDVLYSSMPNAQTIHSIQVMVSRTLNVLRKYGPTVRTNYQFTGAYTEKIYSGTGEFLLPGMILDVSASPDPLQPHQTLKLAIEWRMGLYSIYPELSKVNTIALFNARKNKLYAINVCDIPDQTNITIDTKIIQYKEN